jgi:uncharacterized repeat protein (TIGR02543 family)
VPSGQIAEEAADTEFVGDESSEPADDESGEPAPDSASEVQDDESGDPADDGSDEQADDESDELADEDLNALADEDLNALAADDYHTISFYLDDTGENLFQSRIVPDGENTPEIAIPALSSGPAGSNSFWGWYTEDQVANPPIDPNDAYKFDEPVTADKDYYAVFSDKYLVQFLDGSNNELIIHSAAVSPGSPVSKPSLPILSPSAGKAFTDNWHVVSGSGTLIPTYDFASGVGSNLVLTPDFANIWTVSFVTNGTYQNSQTIVDQAHATQPATPERRGYHFEYWSKNPDATLATKAADEFNFTNTAITQDTVIYAIYTGQPVPYKVVYWLEKPNLPLDFDKDDINNYAFAYIEPATRTGTAGTIVKMTTATVPTTNAFKYAVLLDASGASRGAPYSGLYKSTEERLRGDGTTVVNVYYTRTIYTIQVYLGTRTGAANETLTLNIQPNPAYPGGVQAILTGTQKFLYEFQSKVGLGDGGRAPTYLSNGGIKQVVQTVNGAETYVQRGFGGANALDLYLQPSNFAVSYFATKVDATTFVATQAWMSTTGMHLTEHTNYYESLDQTSPGETTPGVNKNVVTDINAPRIKIETLKYNNGATYNVPAGVQYFETYSNGIARYTDSAVYGGLPRSVGYQKLGALDGGYSRQFQWEKTAGDGTFYQLGGSVGGNATAAHTYYIMRRLSFALGFDTLGHNPVANTAALKYEAPVKSVEPFDADDQAAASAALGLAANEVFEGWFEDSSFMIPFDFDTATMPGDTTTAEFGVIKVLFAKTSVVDHTVNFLITQSGTQVANSGAADGGTIDDPLVYKEGDIDPIYGEFLGWYTIVGSNTIRYNFESPVYADTTVFGMWATDGLTVAYDINDGNGTLPADDNLYALNASARVAPNADFTKGSLVFAGWVRYITDGARYDNIVYYPGMTFSVKSDTTLLARYINPSDAVKLTYYRNVSSSDLIKKAGTHKKYELVSPSDAAALTFARTGYTFLGWSEDPGAAIPDTGLDAAAFADFRIIGDKTLYAVWEIKTYSVTYRGNGHTEGSEPSGTTHGYGDNAAVKTQGTLAKSGYTFAAWNTETDGTGTSYAPGGTISSISGNKTLYAQWTPNGGGGGEPPEPPVIDPPRPRPPVVTEPPAVTPPAAATAADTQVIVPPAGTTGTEVIPGLVEPETENYTAGPTVDLFGNKIPLFGEEGRPSWALVNLLLTIIGVLVAAFTVIAAVHRRRDEKDEESVGLYHGQDGERAGGETRKRFLAGAAVFGILGIVLFVLTENMSDPMVLLDRWTILQAVLAILAVVFGKLSSKRGAEDEENYIAE